MPLSASVFRRGGPKKELFDVVNEGADDEQELDEKLAELDELLHTDKVGRELSAALWRPSLCAAVVVKQRKQTAQHIGFIRNRRLHLQIEEAVFLLDRGDLLLFVEEPGEASRPAGGAFGGDGEDAGGGRRGARRQRLLSVQEAMDLMMSLGVPLERYLLFSALSRSGYLVMRHPSRWLLEREEQPQQIWGEGAWAQCYGGTPAVPGALPPAPMQQQLASAGPAAAATAAAHAAADGPSAMDVDSPAAPAAGPGPGSAAAAAADGRQPGGGSTGGVACRGWWHAAGPGHPHLAGLPESDFAEERGPPVIVEERLAESLRARLPHLRPLPTIQSVASLQPGAATGAAGSVASPSGAPAPAAQAESLEAGGSGSGRGGGVWLGTPSASAHLVFDVYKPGSFVSRYKGQFPAVHTHVAMCSAAPPGLAEMQAADAVAAAAAAGEGGKVAGVTWAAVLNGDIALYSMREADLLCLI